MKILCFSDLHRDTAAADRLVDAAKDADIVIGAGDFATRREGIADTIDILSGIVRPTVLVPGNGESIEELTSACKAWPSAHPLHGSGCEIDGIPFWGVGGGIPVTPFGQWSYDFDEQQAADLLRECQQGGILVVHSPPIDSVDHDTTGKIRGSTTIREVVERTQPKLVVCGHIHSSWEQETSIGTTRVLNAGPRGVVVELA